MGINEITHPIQFTHSETHGIGTDWPSPYQSGTVTNGTPDDNHAAASGNHGTDGGGGFATANSDGTFMRVDGEDDWEIGGRNYFSPRKFVENRGSNLYKVSDDGALTITGTDPVGVVTYAKIADLEPNTMYTMSFSRPVKNRFILINADGEYIPSLQIGDWNTDNTVLNFTTKEDTVAIKGKFVLLGSENDNYPIDVFVKIEKGNKATDWSPSPEDVDNVPSDGKSINCNKLELMTYNNVTNKANINLQTGERNRIDYIETVKYTFEHNRMGIEVELEALEDFYINWYMGLQITRPGWNYDAYFNRDLSQTELYVQNTSQLDSGTKAQSPNMERATMRNNKGDAIHIMLDKDFGVGYSKIRDSDTICYLRDSFQKFYFHLVKNNNSLIVPKGERVRYRGAYIFGKNKAKNATNVTYFTEDGIKKAFVDFKVIATENISYSSVEESFNCTFDDNSVTSTEPNAYAKIII